MFLLTRGKLHETTETPESACRISQVIITGVPSEKFKIPAEWISENSAIVNFAGTENVDRDEILKIPGVKYVPLIGKVTVAMLERNALRLYENFAQSS
jgi:methylenetetrahydrofolate dehydrogenase (NAD+)